MLCLRFLYSPFMKMFAFAILQNLHFLVFPVFPVDLNLDLCTQIRTSNSQRLMWIWVYHKLDSELQRDEFRLRILEAGRKQDCTCKFHDSTISRNHHGYAICVQAVRSIIT